MDHGGGGVQQGQRAVMGVLRGMVRMVTSKVGQKLLGAGCVVLLLVGIQRCRVITGGYGGFYRVLRGPIDVVERLLCLQSRSVALLRVAVVSL